MFCDDDEHAAKRRQIGAKRPRADTTIVIYFTARSASSWLSSILEATRRMGKGLELFNPNFMPDIARHFGARDLDEYVSLAKRYTQRGGVFSFEATPGHIMKVFGNGERFAARFGGAHNVLLFRRNIVAQGISLAKMVEVNVSHAPALSEAQIRDADNAFTYDAGLFRKWITHLLHHELWLEAHLAASGIRPLVLTYEAMTAEGARATLNRIATHAGLGRVPDDCKLDTLHRKIGSPRNEDYEARFRAEERSFLEEVERRRQDLLARSF